MRLGQVLYEPGQQLSHAYFPGTAVVSLHYVTRSGASAEVSGVGPERRGRAVRRTWVSPADHDGREGLRRTRPVDEPAASLHAGTDDADCADRRLQPAPLPGPAPVARQVGAVVLRRRCCPTDAPPYECSDHPWRSLGLTATASRRDPHSIGAAARTSGRRLPALRRQHPCLESAAIAATGPVGCTWRRLQGVGASCVTSNEATCGAENAGEAKRNRLCALSTRRSSKHCWQRRRTATVDMCGCAAGIKALCMQIAHTMSHSDYGKWCGLREI